MTFDLRTIRHFVTLASRLNYVRAADDLRIAQPKLTRSIQSLEEHLGLRLFGRDRSGLNLTFQGERIVEQARALLADAAELEVVASKAAQGQRGRVRFGMAPMPARAILAATLKRRYIAAPEVAYDVVVRRVSDLWPLLLSGDIEFFVGAEGQIPEAPVIRTDTLGTFPISLLVRDGHPLLNDIEKRRTFPLLLASGANTTLPPLIASRVAGPPSVIEDFETLQRLSKRVLEAAV